MIHATNLILKISLLNSLTKLVINVHKKEVACVNVDYHYEKCETKEVYI